MKSKVFLALLCVYGLYVLLYFYFWHKPCTYINGEEEKEKICASSLVLETAAHIPPSAYSGYTLVWSDSATDRAVYIKDGYTPFNPAEIGDAVTVLGADGIVTGTDEQGIYIKLSQGTVYKGMSGSYVYLDSVPIAFVSRAVDLYTFYAPLL